MKFFRFILSLFHPLLMPVYYLLALFSQLGFLKLLSPWKMILDISILMVIFPMLIMLFCKIKGWLHDIHNPTRREKNYLLIVMSIVYFLSVYFCIHRYMDKTFLFFFLTLVISIFLIYLIFLFYDIDIHMYALGALLGLLVVTALNFGRYEPAVITSAILAAGLTGTAQLKVTERKPRDIYFGFGLGLVVVMVLHFFFN